MQRENLAASPNLRNKGGKKGQPVPARGSKQARRLEPCRKRATKTKEAQRERGTLSCRGEMRDFVFLEQSHVKEVISYWTYRPEEMSFGSSAGNNSLRSYQPEAIVYGPINQKAMFYGSSN